jgi:hypothetical protein
MPVQQQKNISERPGINNHEGRDNTQARIRTPCMLLPPVLKPPLAAAPAAAAPPAQWPWVKHLQRHMHGSAACYV